MDIMDYADCIRPYTFRVLRANLQEFNEDGKHDDIIAEITEILIDLDGDDPEMNKNLP